MENDKEIRFRGTASKIEKDGSFTVTFSPDEFKLNDGEVSEIAKAIEGKDLGIVVWIDEEEE